MHHTHECFDEVRVSFFEVFFPRAWHRHTDHNPATHQLNKLPTSTISYCLIMMMSFNRKKHRMCYAEAIPPYRWSNCLFLFVIADFFPHFFPLNLPQTTSGHVFSHSLPLNLPQTTSGHVFSHFFPLNLPQTTSGHVFSRLSWRNLFIIKVWVE